MATAYIYKIYSPKGDKCYIGSTTQPINRRWNCHTGFYRLKKGNCKSFEIFDEYGIEHCTYEILETVQWTQKSDYLLRERHWIENTPSNMNQMKPYITVEERREQGRKNTSKFAEKNKGPIQCECGMTYSYVHKARHLKTEKHLLRMKANGYVEPVKEEVKEEVPLPIEPKATRVKATREVKLAQHSVRSSRYYEAHKEKIAEKMKETITCECGSVVVKHTLQRHLRSVKHQDYIKPNKETPY